VFSSAKSLMRRIRLLSPAAPAPESPVWTNQLRALTKYSIGDWTYGCPIVRDWNQKTTLVIGKYCSIADGVTIFLGGNHRTDYLTTFPFAELLNASNTVLTGMSKGDVRIGHDVWIGAEAMILSGVSIGCGAVIGARSVVTSSIEPYSFAAGNPARHIRFRVPENLIPQMLSIAWWNWPHNEVIKAAPLLLSTSFQEFIDRYASQNLSNAI
jgi:acetyltransferase-like isoleucine patch superfamily enzyme